MSLVGKEKIRKDIPGEPGEWMEFRELSGSELDEADRVATRHIIDMMQGVDLSALKTPTEVDETRRRQAAYDADVLIKYGVVTWSYEEPCTEENKRLLASATRNWARDVILDMNLRTEEQRDPLGAPSSMEPSQVSSGPSIDSN